MRIGIDLLWVRPGKCGGTESYIRNLLEGFGLYCPQDEFLLYVTRDNRQSFEKYRQYSNMRFSECPTDCAVQWKRIAWENLFLAKRAEKDAVDLMFIPVYSKPQTYRTNIPYVTVIHDLQALHYPQYFSKIRLAFLKNKWRYACRTSAQVLTDSGFCRKDLIRHYPFAKDRIKTIYVPILQTSGSVPFEVVAQKYDLCAGSYFYCVSSLLPHKNLITVLKVMSELKRQGKAPKLVLSGVGGQSEEFAAKLKELDIEDVVVQTGFVPDEERDALYENCKIFLFPSIFEGFGMPPIEAMRKKKAVVMTKKSCLEEVTQGKAVYVEKPTDIDEWIRKIDMAGCMTVQQETFPQYELETIVGQLREVFTHVVGLQ